MSARLLLGVALVANILVLVICTCTATSKSSASATGSSSYASSSASSKADATSKPKCRKAGKCPAHERYSECIQGECRALECSEKNQAIACIRIDPQYCKKGCVCEEGYLRNGDGVCVKEDKCEPTCCTSPNEEFVHCMQGVCRAKNCSEKGQNVPCPDIPPEECDSGCICKENFLRAADGTCVPEDKCEPTSCTSPNEEFVPCMQGVCRAKNCSEKGQDVPCPDIPPEECDSGCICKENFLRAADGTCVPEDKCEPTSCTSPNEEFVPCMQGVCRAKNCSEKGQDVPCPDIPPEECDSGCICKENFLRAADGTCVPEDKCEPTSCTSPNEEFVPCMQGVCRAKNCSEKGQDVPCPDIPPEECDSGCICKENFLRAADGTCVPEDKCEPTSCPVNEELSNCTQRECRAKDCYDRYLSIPCPSIPEESCEKGCICKWGYLRDVNNVCIPADQCPANPCPYNQRFTNCTQEKCIQKCFDEKMSEGCPVIAEEDCTEGCVCQKGYLQAEDGYCVPEDQCESTICPPFEQWAFCSNANCGPEHCSQKGLSLPCPGVSQCIPGCLCQGGYLRNESGVCVPETECKEQKCPNPNEQWSTCTQATCRAQNCTERGKPVYCPRIAEGYCKEGCICVENHLRNENGDCVPEDECEPQPPCDENEILFECPQSCNTDYCPKSADEEQKCTQTDPCVPTCKCRFNYKRDDNGKCIPTTECPAFDCSAKENEVYVACPPYCPSDECGGPRLTGRCPFRIGLTLLCTPKCQCKDGYGRVNGTCVPFAECPDLCPSNEVYSPCVQDTCRPQNCSERDVAMETCPTSDPADCHRGCVCQENYYRNEKGVCVSYEECGGPMCPRPHEVYTPNFYKCPPNICNSLVAKYKCDGNQTAEPACVCESGYLRLNETSPCIPICECPEMESSPDCK